MPAKVVQQTDWKLFHKINQIYRPVAPARAFYIVSSLAPKKTGQLYFSNTRLAVKPKTPGLPTNISHHYHIGTRCPYFRINSFYNFINRFPPVAIHRFQSFAYPIRFLFGLGGKQN